MKVKDWLVIKRNIINWASVLLRTECEAGTKSVDSRKI